MKFSKRKFMKVVLILSFTIVSLFSSIYFILKNFNIQKKQVNSGLVQTNLNKNNSVLNIQRVNLKQAPQIISNQYKTNDWRIIIQKLNLNAPILEGTDSEALRKGVGHFESTGIESGNICLAVHNRGYKYNFFQEIKKLEIGDEIQYLVNGKELKFQVISNNIIEETDISVIENTNDDKLTLITCEENNKEYRRCIQAEKIL